MKLDKLVGDRFKERPSDCQIDSHAIMVRGGYIKYMANGIFSSYAPTKRITKKIEQIIREEMDKIDGQEVQFPVVMPASLWQDTKASAVSCYVLQTATECLWYSV